MSGFSRLPTLMLFALTACAAPSPPPTPQLIGWKHLDARPASGPLFQQTLLICQDEATRAANAGNTYLMQAMVLDSTLKSCMARSGYLPIYGVR